jgi:glycosyltransferase involved in cell wall biosynthesis
MQSGGLRTKGITKQSQPDMPLITVVTVVRNGEKTLEQTMLSVINQTYANVGYIVVDGASTDGTLDIIRKYEDRIDYWMSDPDEGIYYAMNKGIDLATGDYIVLLNSDDWFEGDVCQIVVNEISKQKYMMYYAIARVFDSDGNVIYLHGSTINYISKQSIAHQTCFISKEIYQKEKYSLYYKSASDYDFFSRMASKHIDSKFIEKIFVNYRLNGMSDSIFGQLETIKIKKKYHYITYINYLIHKIYLNIMLFMAREVK